jgi:DNA repair protein RadC
MNKLISKCFKIEELKVSRIGRRHDPRCLDRPEVLLPYWFANVAKASWFDDDKEACIVFLLNSKHEALGFSLVTLGILNQSLIHAREVFRPAIAAAAFAIVLAHNHPSGNTGASVQDRELTNRLVDAAQLLQIRLVDHVILGRFPGDGYFSFAEAGLMGTPVGD